MVKVKWGEKTLNGLTKEDFKRINDRRYAMHIDEINRRIKSTMSRNELYITMTALILMIPGYFLIDNYRIFLGVFIMQWANNIGNSLKYQEKR
jgi:hypothetical protein